MAAIAPGTGADVVYQDGRADRLVLIALKNVTTGDTIDVGLDGLNALSFVNRGVVLGVTQFVAIAATWAGTIVEMPSGLANDVAYLLLWGSGT
jgi:hypothetical protein